MRLLRVVVLAFTAFLVCSPIAAAGETDPLFVNLTSDNGHRSNMALVFSKNQLDRKHAVTIFLNDRGVLLAAKSGSKKFKGQQEALAGLLKQGATVLACPFCMKHYRVKEADLLDGVKVGSPELVGAALFKDNTKTMTW